MDEKEMVIVPGCYHCDYAMTMACNDMVNAGIKPGDMLYIRAQQTAKPWEIVAVRVDGETRLRQVVVWDADHAELLAHPYRLARPERYAGADRERVQIVGKVVGLARSFERKDTPHED